MNIRFPDTFLSYTLIVMSLLCSAGAPAYPIDGYERTGIGRLEAARRIETEQSAGSKQPAGALLDTAEVDLRLLGHADMELPAVDENFTRQIREILGEYANRYAVSVLDLSDVAHPRYAEHNGNVMRNPGSVGKLMIALGVFQMLADLYPDDTDKRWQLLRDTLITADDFIISDHHTVRRWDREQQKLIRRPLHIGDRGTLMEFMDWMLSASSNAAGATITKHAMLLKAFGHAYPVSDEQGKAYFEQTAKAELSRVLAETIQEPVTRNGLDLNTLRQGSFFTRTGKQKVPGTTSYATSRALMSFMLRLEQGRIVDPFSSREIKRLLYVTERRIRYASSLALKDAAVYFKSGSLYQCAPEPDFRCKKYHGNVRNYMNSVAIVEAPAQSRQLHYIVTLTSNVLRRNSAIDHQSFATRVHHLIKSFHEAADTSGSMSYGQ